MTAAQFRKLALSFPDTEENPHFDRAAFKIVKKRIFATLHEPSACANLKLPLKEQSVFCTFGKEAVYAVPNKWGQQGWTTFELKKISSELMRDALDVAYREALEPSRRE